MTMWTLVAVVAVVLAASIFQGAIGFGGNLIAQPIIFQLAPELTPVPVLLAMTTLSCLVLIREPAATAIRPLGVATIGTLAGVGVGVAVLRAIDEATLSIVVALCVLAMVAITASRASLALSTRNLTAAGALGGFGYITAGIGGPPIALLRQGAPGGELRGFMSAYNLVASALAVAVLAAAGRMGRDELIATVWLLPVIAIGFMLSRPLLPVVDRGATRPAILVVSGGAALLLLVRSLFPA